MMQAFSSSREAMGVMRRSPQGKARHRDLAAKAHIDIAAGLALAHVPDAVVKHAHHLTLRRFLRQHFNYGRGILAIRLMRKARSQTRLVPEPSGFYVNLVLSPLRTQTGKRSLRASLLIALAQVATAAGATAQAVRWPLDRPVAEGERSR